MEYGIIDFADRDLLQDDCVLREVDNQATFDNLIVPEQLAHLKDAGHLTDGIQPIAIFVVGQTGAGKTRLATDLLGALQARQAAHLIPEKYKTYRESARDLLLPTMGPTRQEPVLVDMLISNTDPEYAVLNKIAPHLASRAASTDAREWLDQAITWVLRRRIDVLLEFACRRPEDITPLVSTFHSAGYKVLVAVMAVPECLSLLGTIVRYYKRLPEAQSANVSLRITSRKVHDETYDGILAIANFIDSSAAATNVVVVRRNNLVAYQNYRGPNGLWVRPASALAALDLERTRPLPAAEHSSFLADYQYFEEQKSKNGLEEATLDNVEASLAGLMSMGGRLSASFPALKPLDIHEWVLGK